MKRGDISNRVSSLNVGVRLNGFLVDPERLGFIHKAWSKLSGKYAPGSINPSAARFVERLYYKTSVTVDVVFVGKPAEKLKKYLKAVQGLPYNRAHLVEDLYGVENLLYGGVLSYFVAAPLDVAQINGEYAYSIERFNLMLKKGKVW